MTPRNGRRTAAIRACCSAVVLGFASGFSVASAQPAADTLPPVLLIHGFKSNSETWNTLVDYLAWAQVQRVKRTSTDWQLPILLQRDQVVDYALQQHVDTASPLVVGHSMGGLVARAFTKVVPSDAIITIGSPHHGHGLANPAPFLNHMTEIHVAAATAVLNLWKCGQIRTGVNGEDVYGPCYEIWGWTFVVGDFLALAGSVAAAHLGSYPSTYDMRGGDSTTFIGQLNQSAEIAQEQVGIKIAVLGQLEPFEAGTAFYRNLFSPPWAEFTASLVHWWGFYAALDGMEIILDADWQDPWYLNLVMGGLAVHLGGQRLMGWPVEWSNMVGGWPNDGFMPVNTQSWQGATPVFVTGPTHSEQTESHELRQIVLDLAAQLKRD